MENVLIGCGQITWIRFTDKGAEWQASEEQVLAEIAEAGYDGAPAGPGGDRTPAQLLELYASKGLRPAPGYYGASFWDRSQRAALMDGVREHARFAQEVGCTELYVAPGGFDYRTRSGKTRRETAGHVLREDSLTDDEFAAFGEALNEAGAIALEYGVSICFHNHVGTVIETREEVDRLLALTDPALVFMGFDTGHLAWAGADPVEVCRDYAARIKTLHLKDIDPAVRDRGRAAGWDYFTFNHSGIFAELGEGCVDFPAILQMLKDQDFAGWLVVETDVTTKPTARDSITISRDYLRGLGY